LLVQSKKLNILPRNSKEIFAILNINIMNHFSYDFFELNIKNIVENQRICIIGKIDDKIKSIYIGNEKNVNKVVRKKIYNIHCNLIILSFVSIIPFLYHIKNNL